MTLLTDMANAETALVHRIERWIETMAGGGYDPGMLTNLLADLAALRTLIRAKKI
jgi:ribosomal 50S subunit-associated protein YjgA (DUF615 family)